MGPTEVAEPRWSDGLLEAGFGDPDVAALVGWPARIARMVEVEAALGRALGRAGVVSDAVAAAIAAACDVDRVNLDDLARSAATSATPAIPLVHALVAGCENSDAAAWLHHGATSQDVVDTAAILQVRDGLECLDAGLAALARTCAALASAHRDTVMAGRTLGQQAAPTTFGLQAARWLGAVGRRRRVLAALRAQVLVVQFGGATGTLSVYGQFGPAVLVALADELGLGVPELPWHAERDRVVDLAGWLSGVTATVEQAATSLVLHGQTEIGELRQTATSGSGSSAMPHKANPTHAVAARAAARLARGECQVLADAAGGNEFERAAGAWQAEWVALPSALVRTGGAVVRLRAALDALEVDADRMRANLTAGLGLTSTEALASALTPAMGRPGAQSLVGELAARAVAESRPLGEVAEADERVTDVLDPATLATSLDAAAVVATAGPLVDRALAAHDDLLRELPAP